MKIMHRYIAKEFIPKFFTSLLVLTFILLMDQLFDLADLLLNRGAGLINTIRLFLYILPSLFMFTVPMAILSGTVLLFSRLNDDNEITAIRTSGITTLSIIKPVVIISFLLSLIMLYFNSTVAPSSNYNFKTLYYQILYKNPVMQFSEKNFVQIQNYDIYVNKISKENVLKKILIYKWGEGLPTITTAETGRIAIAEDKGILFHLDNGKIFSENPESLGEFNVSSFSENELILEITKKNDLLPNWEGGTKQLRSKELIKKIKTVPANIKNFYITEYHLRMALACAGFLFVFIAAPLSLMYRKRAKSYGITSMIGIIFLYYIFLIIGTTLGERGFLNPMISVWIPNFIVGSTGVFLISKIIKR